LIAILAVALKLDLFAMNLSRPVKYLFRLEWLASMGFGHGLQYSNGSKELEDGDIGLETAYPV